MELDPGDAPAPPEGPAGRIVNVSSVAATQITTGLGPAAVLRAPAYSVAKHLLNVLTSKLAGELHDAGILVNAVDPGETASHPERGDDGDDRPAADSARGVVWAATLDNDGPSGGFFRDGRSLT